jgi:diacylglycerol kinase family enzyme
VRIAVVVNPAAGTDQPILGPLNRVFQAAGADWEVFITRPGDEGKRIARAAVEAGFDVVAVYGGDGTVGEVASGLIGAAVPMAILPGGTANVLAVELGIPTDLIAAATLAVSPDRRVRRIDTASASFPGDAAETPGITPYAPGGAAGWQREFVLRAGFGLEAAMVGGANRERKDRLRNLAYAMAALEALRQPPSARYSLTLDGQERVQDLEGVTCIVANSGSLGIAGLRLVPTIDVSDGLLDVVVLPEADLRALLAVAASVVSGRESTATLHHWQAREVLVRAEPVQSVTVDGELFSPGTPLRVCVRPGAVAVIVPGEAPSTVL